MVRPRVARVWRARSLCLQFSAPRTRGLTLLEILIVLVLILAAAAIAIPAMTQRFESTRFDATIDQVVATLALARAESQRARRPVQVMWDPTDRVVYAAWLDTSSPPAGDQQDGPTPSTEAFTRSADVSLNDDTLSGSDRLNAAAGIGAKAMATGGSRLRVVLPEGCRVKTRSASDAEVSEEASTPAAEPTGQSRGPEAAEPVSLIVYMPDGSTFGDASFTVVDRGGRQSRVEVNPWTGQASVSRSISTAPMTSPDTASEQPDSSSDGEAQP